MQKLAALVADGDSFDLVIAVVELAEPDDERTFDLLACVTAVDGWLVLFARNTFLPGALRQPWHWPGAVRGTRGRYREQLSRAGFRRVDGFVPMPTLLGAEEYVTATRSRFELSRKAPRFRRAVNEAGLYATFHEGWLFLASRTTSAVVLTQALGPRLGIVRPVLERFDLRPRGSLLLVITGDAARERLVCRVTTDELTAALVGRNSGWAQRVRSDPRLGSVRAVIPRQRDIIDLANGRAHVEECIPGSIGWKVAGEPRLERRLFAGLCAFAVQFATATRERRVLDAAAIEDLLRPAEHARADGETETLVGALREQLRTRLADRELALAWSHGDFGYGNAIADPKSGALRGIIDWEHARTDVEGIDRLNFALQRERILRGGSLPDALQRLAPAFLDGGFAALSAELTGPSDNALARPRRATLLACAALRIVQREMEYPELFGAHRAAAHSLLRHAREIVHDAG